MWESYGYLFVVGCVFTVHLVEGVPDFIYYKNAQGTEVVEVLSKDETQCHVFDYRHATWVVRTRHSIVQLDPISFEILREMCGPSLLPATTENTSQSANTTAETDDDLLRHLKDLRGHGGSSVFDPNGPSGEFNETLFKDDGSGSPLVYPGTKWCGRGDTASNDDDLGIYSETDRCCREHDKCPDNIRAKTTNQKYNLTNDGDYTKSHCDCDSQFLQCLDKDRTLSGLASFEIANIYFNLLRPECFDFRHPPTDKCKKTRITGECVVYDYDFTKPANYRFFTAQPFVLREVKGLYDKLVPHLPKIPLPKIF